MRRTLLMSVFLCLAFFSSGATGDRSREAATSAPSAYITDLAGYDFEDGFGGPDPQGWTTVDLTTRPDTFTHVDDFAGLPAPYAPIEGGRSLWIGARPAPELCSYPALPGYGNAWYENFESVSFATTGDVTLTYSIFYDTESFYDFVYVDYRSRTGKWWQLASYDGPYPPLEGVGIGPILESYTVPADSLDGLARFRFRFLSDGAVSNQGGYIILNTVGAAVIDSITVTDNGGVVDYQDFEAEAVGARSTSDGDWHAGITDYFGDFGGLVDGATVLQEDTVVVNTSHFWSFFNGSTDTYASGGYPDQASIPLVPLSGATDPPVYISNGAASPIIDLTRDKNGFPVAGPPDQLSIEYDVYVDLVPDNHVLFNVAVKVFRDGCFDAFWSYYNPNNFDNDNKAWSREQSVINLPSNASHVQVMLFAFDNGGDGIHTYNSHAPLFDNVSIKGYFDTASAAGDTPATGYALHANVPNPFNPSTVIKYDVPVGGGEVSLRIYDVAGRLVRTLVDRNETPGRKSVTWRGNNDNGQSVSSGVYFYRMTAPGFTQTLRMVLLK